MKKLFLFLLSAGTLCAATEDIKVDSDTRQVINAGYFDFAAGQLRIAGVPITTTGGGGGGGGLVSVPIGNTVFVDAVNGSDSTALRGRLDLQCKTIPKAVTLMQASDLMSVGPGTYVVDAPIILPFNGGLQGAGRNATVIQSTYGNTGGPADAIIVPGDKSYISDLTVQGTAPDAIPGIYQVPIGGNNHTFTDVVISNVRLIGDSDGIWIKNDTAACSLKVYDSIIETRWDCLAFISPVTIDLFNVSAKTVGPTAQPPVGGRVINIAASAGGTVVNWYGGYMEASGNTSNSGVVASSGRADIHNVTTNISGAAPADFRQLGSGIINVDNVTRSDGGPLVTTGTVNRLGRELTKDSDNIVTLAPGANVSVPGLEMRNVTPASLDNQQFPPSIIMEGRRWTTAGAGLSQQVRVRFKAEPVQTATNVGGAVLTIGSSVGAGGAYHDEFQLHDQAGLTIGAAKTPPGSGLIGVNGVRYTPSTVGEVTIAPEEGTVRAFTDSVSNAWGATIVGGGANHVLGYYNGTTWTVIGK